MSLFSEYGITTSEVDNAIEAISDAYKMLDRIRCIDIDGRNPGEVSARLAIPGSLLLKIRYGNDQNDKH